MDSDDDDFEYDADEEFDMEDWDDGEFEEDIEGGYQNADLKVSGHHGSAGLFASGCLCTLTAALHTFIAVLYFMDSEPMSLAIPTALPIVITTGLEMYLAYKRGVRKLLLLYPAQLHYFIHMFAGFDTGMQSVMFSGMRAIFCLLQAGPMCIMSLVRLIQVDWAIETAPPPPVVEPGDNVFIELNTGYQAILPRRGILLLSGSVVLSVLSILATVASDLKVRKQRPSITAKLDTCAISLRERAPSTAFAFTELSVTSLIWGLAFYVLDLWLAFVLMLLMYLTLWATWRWWSKTAPGGRTMELTILAAVSSAANLAASLYTGGDAECSVIYGLIKPLDAHDVEFMHSSMWLPDFAALHAVRTLWLILVLLVVRLVGLDSAPDSVVLQVMNDMVGPFFIAQHVILVAYFTTWKLSCFQWGGKATSRSTKLAMMAQRAAAYQERWGVNKEQEELKQQLAALEAARAKAKADKLAARKAAAMGCCNRYGPPACWRWAAGEAREACPRGPCTCCLFLRDSVLDLLSECVDMRKVKAKCCCCCVKRVRRPEAEYREYKLRQKKRKQLYHTPSDDIEAGSKAGSSAGGRRSAAGSTGGRRSAAGSTGGRRSAAGSVARRSAAGSVAGSQASAASAARGSPARSTGSKGSGSRTSEDDAALSVGSGSTGSSAFTLVFASCCPRRRDVVADAEDAGTAGEDGSAPKNGCCTALCCCASARRRGTKNAAAHGGGKARGADAAADADADADADGTAESGNGADDVKALADEEKAAMESDVGEDAVANDGGADKKVEELKTQQQEQQQGHSGGRGDDGAGSGAGAGVGVGGDAAGDADDSSDMHTESMAAERLVPPGLVVDTTQQSGHGLALPGSANLELELGAVQQQMSQHTQKQLQKGKAEGKEETAPESPPRKTKITPRHHKPLVSMGSQRSRRTLLGELPPREPRPEYNASDSDDSGFVSDGDAFSLPSARHSDAGMPEHA